MSQQTQIKSSIATRQNIDIKNDWLGVTAGNSSATDHSFSLPAYVGDFNTFNNPTPCTGILRLQDRNLSFVVLKDNRQVFKLTSKDIIKVKFPSKLALALAVGLGGSCAFIIYTKDKDYEVRLGTAKDNVIGIRMYKALGIPGVMKLYAQIQQILSNVYPDKLA